MVWVEIPDVQWGEVAMKAASLGVEPTTVISRALDAYLGTKPSTHKRGRPPKFPLALRDAVRALRAAGVSPGQIAAGRIGDLQEVANGATGVVWGLRKLGPRYPAREIELEGELKDAVAVLLRFGREGTELEPSAPILANANGSVWSARMVAYVSRR